jgi:hypothetical protein
MKTIEESIATKAADAAARAVRQELCRRSDRPIDEEGAEEVAREVELAAMFAGGRAYAVKALATEEEDRADRADAR